MAKKPLNHSRYLDYYAKDIGDSAYQKAKQTPTAKQVRFYKRLFAMCKENGLDTDTGDYARTRVEIGWAIDKLLERLQAHGIDINGNGKDATYVLEVGVDRRGRSYAHERIKVDNEPETCAEGAE